MRPVSEIPVAWGRLLGLCLSGSLCLGTLHGCVVEERTFDEKLAKERAADDKKDDEPSDKDAAAEMVPQDSGSVKTPQFSAECEEYCTEVMSACTDELAVYASEDACLALCSYLPTKGDAKANNVSCRLRQAKLAASTGEPEVHCPSAGPGGNTQGANVGCGDNCESYCMLHPLICERIDGEPIFETEECLRRCGALQNDKTFDVDYHHDGDNVQCRLVHLSSGAISESAAETHCWHARLTPRDESPCGNLPDQAPSCEQYCDVVMTACEGEFKAYESKDDCMGACAAMPPGKSSDTTPNSVGCRLYHSYSALDSPEVHCSHAGPTGDGHCGVDNCETYCPLLKAACGEAYAAEYADDDDCLTQCSGLDGAEADQGYAVEPAPKGDSVQCRFHHTVKAFADTKECTAALGGGACQ